MITNFQEFYQAIKDSDYTMTADNLSLAEQTLLRVLVAGASEELVPAEDVLSDYFGIQIPRSLLSEILQNDLDLAMETFTNGISDTCQRDILITAVLKRLGAPDWPTYGDGKEASEKFFKALPEFVEKAGGKMVT